MKSTLERLEANKVKLQIEVDAESFERHVNNAWRRSAGRYNIPGFRKGKAPRRVIERMMGEGVFFEDAFRDAYPDAYDQAVAEHALEPVEMPEIDIVSIGNAQDLVFTATVTLKPEVELGAYKGIECRRIAYTVSDEDIEAELSRARERLARFEEADRPIESGDRIVLDYAGTVDGVAFEGGTAQDQPLEIGSGRFIPGFEEQLIGMKAGDQGEVNVTFPEEYHAEELKGKSAVFAVTIKDVKAKELPELDDEFAKDASEFDTLDEFRADIRKRLETASERRAQSETENSLIETVVANAKVDIPEVMIDNQVEASLRDMAHRLSHQGLRFEDYLKYTGMTIEQMREQYRPDSAVRVRTQLVLEKLVKEENLSATGEEIDAEIARVAEQVGKSVQEYKESAGAQELSYIEDGIVYHKLIDLLKENCVWTEAQAQADEEKPKKPRARKPKKAEAAQAEEDGQQQQ